MQMLECRPRRIVVDRGEEGPLDLYDGYVQTVCAERDGDDEPFAWIVLYDGFPNGRLGDDDAPRSLVVVDDDELPGRSVWYIWDETLLTPFVAAGWLARRMQDLAQKYPDAQVHTTVLLLDGPLDVDEFLQEPLYVDEAG